MRIMRRLVPWMLVLGLLGLAVLGCGGSSTPAGATESGSLARIEAPRVPVTLCISGALASQDPADRVECLLNVLDEHDLITQMDPREKLHAKFAGMVSRIGAEKVAALDAEVDRLFDPAVMQAAFESKISAGYDDAQGRLLLEFYATELGTTYASLAVSAGDSEDGAATSWLQSHPPSEARKAQVSKLIAAAQGREMMRAMLLEPAVAMIKASASVATPETVAEQIAKTEEVLQPLLVAVNEAIEGQTAYMLRDFDDAQVEQVIAAESSAHAQWFTNLRLSSFRAVIGDAYTGLGLAIAAQAAPASASR